VNADERLQAIVDAQAIGDVQHHIFLCANQTNPKCAPREETNELWSHLKSRLKKLGLTSAPPTWHGSPEADATPVEAGDGTVLRSKVDCLRICEQGPICVIYPEGTWYSKLTIEKLDQIIDSHLAEGRPIDDLVFAVGDLTQ
jgi:(2Fe-2S) ferredoxin